MSNSFNKVDECSVNLRGHECRHPCCNYWD